MKHVLDGKYLISVEIVTYAGDVRMKAVFDTVADSADHGRAWLKSIGQSLEAGEIEYLTRGPDSATIEESYPLSQE